VGKGAEQWAISHGIPACPTEKMTTSECQTTHTLLSAALTAVFFIRFECNNNTDQDVSLDY